MWVFVSKVLIRLHLSSIVYIFLKVFVRKKKMDLMDVEKAERILSSVYKDNGETCVCYNEIAENPAYDLQIIIPVYNVAKHVKKCLDSVVCQQSQYKVKVVVIDDGSTDESPDILKEYDGLENFTIITQENRGFSGARNRGLEKLDARYVMFLDSDDCLLDGAIDALMHKAYLTDADIVAGGYRLVSELGGGNW